MLAQLNRAASAVQRFCNDCFHPRSDQNELLAPLNVEPENYHSTLTGGARSPVTLDDRSQEQKDVPIESINSDLLPAAAPARIAVPSRRHQREASAAVFAAIEDKASLIKIDEEDLALEKSATLKVKAANTADTLARTAIHTAKDSRTASIEEKKALIEQASVLIQQAEESRKTAVDALRSCIQKTREQLDSLNTIADEKSRIADSAKNTKLGERQAIEAEFAKFKVERKGKLIARLNETLVKLETPSALSAALLSTPEHSMEASHISPSP